MASIEFNGEDRVESYLGEASSRLTSVLGRSKSKLSVLLLHYSLLFNFLLDFSAQQIKLCPSIINHSSLRCLPAYRPEPSSQLMKRSMLSLVRAGAGRGRTRPGGGDNSARWDAPTASMIKTYGREIHASQTGFFFNFL